MCQPFEIAEKTVKKFLEEKKPFTYKQLCDEIKENGGVLVISPSLNISEYLDELTYDKKVIYFDEETHQFKFISEFRKQFKKEHGLELSTSY